jgi:hypothetical protein
LACAYQRGSTGLIACWLKFCKSPESVKHLNQQAQQNNKTLSKS